MGIIGCHIQGLPGRNLPANWARRWAGFAYLIAVLTNLGGIELSPVHQHWAQPTQGVRGTIQKLPWRFQLAI